MKKQESSKMQTYVQKYKYNICKCTYISLQFSLVELLSCVQIFVTPWSPAHQAFLSITNSQSLPKLMSIESVMPSNHLNGKMQMKTTMRYHPTFFKMVIIKKKKQKTASVGKDVEKLESLCITGGHIVCCSYYAK